MELYKSISRIVATALFASSLVVVSLSIPNSAAPDPIIQWSVCMKDSVLNVVTVEGKVFGRTGRKFAFSAAETDTGGRLEPIGIEAFGPDGLPLEIKAAANRWEVVCGESDFTLRYDLVMTIVDRYTPEVRGMLSHLGPDRSRLMGRDLFVQPEHPVLEGILIDIDLHGGSKIGAPWETTGTRMIVPAASELPMTLVAAGGYRFLETFVSGTRLVLAVGGQWDFQDGELLETVRRVVAEEIAMLGSSPRDRHLVICDHNPVKGGNGFDYYGIHFGGTVLLLLDPGIERSELYGVPMSIIAHEFFHNWNGEILRPADDSFMWFTEGATVYFSYKVVLNAGIINTLQYEAAESAITDRYLENALRGSVHLSMAGNNDLSDRDMVNLLYDGGYLAARAIDERILSLTNGRSGLIDVIKRLYREDSGGRDIGARELCDAIFAETGTDLTGFIEGILVDPAPGPSGDVSS
jgi:predicted metalloprotease with PDZ domain